MEHLASTAVTKTRPAFRSAPITVNGMEDLESMWPDGSVDTDRPEVLVADLDHTALGDPELVPRFLVAALFRAGCSVTFDEIRHLIGNPARTILTEMIVRHLAIPLADACRRALAVEAEFSTRLADHVAQAPEFRPMPGAEHAFAALQADGVRVALDSAMNRTVTDALMKRLGWGRSGLVDAVVPCDAIEPGRPAGHAVLLAANRAGAAAGSRIAKLAATAADVAAAHAAGCRWILGFTGGVFTADALKAQRPTRIIGSLGEVSEILIDRVLV